MFPQVAHCEIPLHAPHCVRPSFSTILAYQQVASSNAQSFTCIQHNALCATAFMKRTRQTHTDTKKTLINFKKTQTHQLSHSSQYARVINKPTGIGGVCCSSCALSVILIYPPPYIENGHRNLYVYANAAKAAHTSAQI